MVNIAGQRLTVRSDADDTYIRHLAGFVDRRIDEVRVQSRPATTQKLVLLAAMNIADDLLQMRREHLDLRQKVRERSKAVLAFLDREAEKFSA